MINPVIFSFKPFSLALTLRWYGMLVMSGAVVGARLAEKEINRHGEKAKVFGTHLYGFCKNEPAVEFYHHQSRPVNRVQQRF